MANELMLEESRNTGLIQHVDPAAVAAGEAAKARIQSAYIMAYQNPRNSDQARDRILHACKRPAFAEKVEYSKPVGGKPIKGPSIRLAELALREWGNVLTESQTIYDDRTTRRIRVIATDLETNSTFSKEIQISKTVERKNSSGREVVSQRPNSYGEITYTVIATDDELFTKEAAAISKTLRNEGLRIIPSDIIEEAMDTARNTLQNRDAQDPDAAKKKLLDAFSSIGVKPTDLEKYLGHKTEAIQPAEMADLRTIFQAIRDGESKWSDYVVASEQRTATPEQSGAATQLAAELSGGGSPVISAVEAITDEQITKIRELLIANGRIEDDLVMHFRNQTGSDYAKLSDLTKADGDEAIKMLVPKKK